MKDGSIFKSSARMIGWGFALTLLLGLALIALLLARESRLIYFPQKGHDASPGELALRAEELSLQSPGGPRLFGWRIRGGGGQALLYFHGNAGNISHRLERARLFVESLDLDVFLVDYRGYGRSEGEPGEDGFYADAETVHRAATERGFASDRIILFGESLGSAVAVETALRRPCRAVILETPFLSIPAMAKTIYPFLPGFLIRTRFDNEAKIARLTVPKLIVQAENDEIVPPEQTRRLFELAAPPKRYHVIPGAHHNDTYVVGGTYYLEVWRSFLNRLPDSPVKGGANQR